MPSDASFAIRQLRKSPAFAAAAILTLGLGIGANTAIYQVLDALLFRSLPVRDPARLVLVHRLEGGKPRNFSYPEFRDFAARTPAAEGMFATSDYPLHAAILRGRGQAHPVNAVIVSPEFFGVLGIDAHPGRVLTPADDHSPVAVISDAFWQREFQRSPSAIGQPLQINKSVVTVIGVAPPGFHGEKPGNRPDLWVPMGITPQLLANDWMTAPKSWLTVMARLRPGATLTGADLRVEPAGRGLGELQASFEKPALLLMSAVAVLLLIACANLATLLLGRATARSHEIGVRLALGASRARIVRQLLAESAVLATAGGALGAAVACWSSRALSTLSDIPVEWNGRVLAFTAVATALTAAAFGLVPSLAATRPERPRRAPAFGRALIALQVGLTLLLLSGAALLAQSLSNLRNQDFGFRADRLVIANLPWEFSPSMMARYAALEDPLLERLNGLPGVASAALSGFGPLGADQHTGTFDNVPARIVHVSPRYFETTGIPIVAGRALNETDRAGAPKVVVLSETAARAFFGGANPIGRSIDKGSIQVVGVARDVRFASPSDPFSVVVFVPLRQSPAPITAALARAAGDPAPLAAQVRAALRAVDPDLAVGAVRPVPEMVDAMLGRERLVALLATGFGALALALACVGVYGVVSYAVVRRTREIGIRVALGARRRQVTTMLVREIAAVAGLGIAAGAVASIAAARAIRSLLFGLSPGDYRALAATAFLLALVAALAAYLPARRAARLDPTRALRIE